MKLIVLAAGKGTRFLPITEKTPKALIPILSKPLVEYTLDLATPHVDGIIFVINDNLGFKIREHFGGQYKNIPITYVVQSDKNPKGTFSALLTALPFIDTEIFAVCNSDDLYIKDDIDKAFKNKEYGIGLTVSQMPYIYHGIDTENGYIKGFRRHVKTEDLVKDKFVNGFYILSKKIFTFSPVFLVNGEMGLPHTLFNNLSEFPLKELQFSEWVAVDSPMNIATAENFIRKYYI
ncbi:MAG: sugar phosphate nucleotidyltransferase [Candidatus Nomurabacteria bacterium]|nr:sugar phosphate nucleotidyltransferase [Candidatus Nomurabacteria bacterium]